MKYKNGKFEFLLTHINQSHMFTVPIKYIDFDRIMSLILFSYFRFVKGVVRVVEGIIVTVSD